MTALSCARARVLLSRLLSRPCCTRARSFQDASAASLAGAGSLVGLLAAIAALAALPFAAAGERDAASALTWSALLTVAAWIEGSSQD